MKTPRLPLAGQPFLFTRKGRRREPCRTAAGQRAECNPASPARPLGGRARSPPAPRHPHRTAFHKASPSGTGTPSPQTSHSHPYRLPPGMIPRHYPLQVLPFGLSPYRLRRSPATADAVRLRHLHPGDILAAGGVGRTTPQGCGATPATKTPRLGLGRETRKVSRTRHGAARSSHRKLPIRNPKVSDPHTQKDKCKPFCIPQYNFQQYNILQYNPPQCYLRLSYTHTIHK
jgi:hypothetical protein